MNDESDATTTATSRPTRWARREFLLTAGATLLAGASVPRAAAAPRSAARTELRVPAAAPAARKPHKIPSRATIVREFRGRTPQDFGMFLPGVVTHGKRDIALTFDACGSARGSGYDAALIETLRKAGVPATLFLNARWIAAQPSVAAELAADPLFEIGNHGWHHRPLTVAGQAAYGIVGTRSPGGAYDEVVRGLDAVAELTGSRPRWYRPGTAWADDVGVAIAHRLGLKVISFHVNADAGATASKAEVAANLKGVHQRDVVLAHVNHPEGRTAEGLAKALPRLLDKGRTFCTLSAALA